MAERTCNSRTWEVGAGGSEGQGKPLLQVWDDPEMHEILSEEGRKKVKHSGAHYQW